MTTKDVKATVSTTKAYYDGPADEIYRRVWGGENMHMGIPCSDNCPHPEAMEHTNEILANAANLRPGTRVLEVACGYGATALYLAKTYGCKVTATNISEKELEVGRQRARDLGLSDLVTFEYADFHDLPYPDGSFDVVWSQESFLHGADKKGILKECGRVLVPGGTFLITDILVRRDTPQEDRDRIYERLSTPEIWAMEDYLQALLDLGFEIKRVDDWSQYVARSYGWVLDQVKQHYDELVARAGNETVDKAANGLTFWVDSARAGKVGWGFYLVQKPAR